MSNDNDSKDVANSIESQVDSEPNTDYVSTKEGLITTEEAAARVKEKYGNIDAKLKESMDNFDFDQYGIDKEDFKKFLLGDKSSHQLHKVGEDEYDFAGIVGAYMDEKDLNQKTQLRKEAESTEVILEGEKPSSQERLRSIGQRIREANMAAGILQARLDGAKNSKKSDYTEEEVLEQIEENEREIRELLKIQKSIDESLGISKVG